eukprot:m.171905 g.171905  ORF g.171905 m.171905 type:complete len:125 (-) comp14565_c0_seq5:283-657(-)
MRVADIDAIFAADSFLSKHSQTHTHKQDSAGQRLPWSTRMLSVIIGSQCRTKLHPSRQRSLRLLNVFLPDMLLECDSVLFHIASLEINACSHSVLGIEKSAIGIPQQNRRFPCDRVTEDEEFGK